MIFNVGAGGDTAETVKYDNSKSGLKSDNVQGAVDELNDSLDNIMGGLKIESAMVTTSGETRTITLQNNYTEMTYFNMGAIHTTNVMPARNVVFTSPNKVSFQLRGVGSNGALSTLSTELPHGYLFIGK